MMNIHRYYEILEIDVNASPEEVGQAYEDLLAAWNPRGFFKKSPFEKKGRKEAEKNQQGLSKILTSPSRQREGAPPQGKPPSEVASFFGRFTKPATRKKPKNGHQTYAGTHPWIRLSARMIDYFLFALFLRWVHLFDLALWRSVPSFFFPVVMTFFWVFVEAVLLRVFGVTPGKWMLNTEIIRWVFKKARTLECLSAKYFRMVQRRR